MWEQNLANYWEWLQIMTCVGRRQKLQLSGEAGVEQEVGGDTARLLFNHPNAKGNCSQQIETYHPFAHIDTHINLSLCQSLLVFLS